MSSKTHALKDFKSRTEKLLENKRIRSLCVSGKWGIGKTFAWNELLKEIRKAPVEHEVQYYAYVSLFGLSTIEQVSAAIIQETEQFTFSPTGFWQKFWKWIPSALDLIGRTLIAIVGFIGNLPFLLGKRSPQYFWGLAKHDSVLKAFKAVGNELLPWMPERALICFDDLERKNGSLSIDQIFGLISHLQENLGCKIVFIFNNEKLNKNEADQFHQSYEKVFDSRFLFQPDHQECIDIAFREEAIFREDTSKEMEVRSCIEKLEIQNIRTIKNIVGVCGDAADALTGLDSLVFQQAVSIIVLLEWAVRIGDKTFSKFVKEYILGETRLVDFKQSDDYTKNADKSLSEEWVPLVEQYGFDGGYDFDEEVLNSVESGVFQREYWREMSSELNELSEKRYKREEYNKAWGHYLDSFSDNEEEFSTALEHSFDESVSLQDFHALNSVVGMLADFGKERRAKEITQKYKRTNFDKDENWIREVGIWESMIEIHPLIMETVETAKKQIKPPVFSEVLRNVVAAKVKTKEDLEFLSGSEEWQFGLFLEEFHHPGAIHLIRDFLESTDVKNKALSDTQAKLKSALLKLGSKKRINQRRVNTILRNK